MTGILNYFRQNERGSINVIIAFSLVGLLGLSALVIDAGTFYIADMRLSNSVDAAVLAGAQELHKSSSGARAAAEEYAAKNGLSAHNLEIHINKDNTAITVRGTHEAPLFFGRIFSDDETLLLEKTATAVIGNIGGMAGAAPLGVLEELMEGIEFGEDCVLKVAAGDGFTTGPGNFGALALGGPGANTYRDNLRNGYDGIISMGERVDTEPGNIVGPTVQAIKDRLGNSLSETHTDIPRGCPRVLYIPVIRPVDDPGGRHEVEIVGFAAFWVKEEPRRQGNECDITGRFIRMLAAGELSEGAWDHGLKTVKLVY